MSLITEKRMKELAHAIRPHITPIIAEKGQVDAADVKRLVLRHTGVQVQSERTIFLIQEHLCDV